MLRVPFSIRNDVGISKAKLRGNKVGFEEGKSIVVIKGTTSLVDVPSAIDEVADRLQMYRLRNRAYASHTAAGVVIDPSSGTIRVLTFLPAKPAKPVGPKG